MMTPEAMQAATQVVDGTGSGQVTTLIGLGVLAVSSVGLWLRIIFVEGRKARAEAERAEDESKAPGVPLPGNGLGTLLKEHGEKLKAHETEIKNIYGRLTEIRQDNRDDHEKIFEKIDDLKDVVLKAGK